MEVNKPGGPVAPTAPVHFFQSLLYSTVQVQVLRVHATTTSMQTLMSHDVILTGYCTWYFPSTSYWHRLPVATITTGSTVVETVFCRYATASIEWSRLHVDTRRKTGEQQATIQTRAIPVMVILLESSWVGP